MRVRILRLIQDIADASPSVLVHLIDVLSSVTTIERRPERLEVLKEQARIARDEGEAQFVNSHDRDDLAAPYVAFLAVTAGTTAQLTRQDGLHAALGVLRPLRAN